MAKKPRVALKSTGYTLTIDDMPLGEVIVYSDTDPVVTFDDSYELTLTDLKAIVEALENE